MLQFIRDANVTVEAKFCVKTCRDELLHLRAYGNCLSKIVNMDTENTF